MSADGIVNMWEETEVVAINLTQEALKVEVCLDRKPCCRGKVLHGLLF